MSHLWSKTWFRLGIGVGMAVAVFSASRSVFPFSEHVSFKVPMDVDWAVWEWLFFGLGLAVILVFGLMKRAWGVWIARGVLHMMAAQLVFVFLVGSIAVYLGSLGLTEGEARSVMWLEVAVPNVALGAIGGQVAMWVVWLRRTGERGNS